MYWKLFLDLYSADVSRLLTSESKIIFYFLGLIMGVILIFGISIVFLRDPEIKKFSFLGFEFEKFKKKGP